MQTKINYQKKISHFLNRMSDVRFSTQVLFVIIVLLISWSGVKSIQANYGLQKQINELDQQNKISQMENDNLRLQNEYYKSNQYLELSARRNFGLAAPGGKVIVIPQSVALAYVANVKLGNGQQDGSSKKTAIQNNAQSWLNFFLNRNR
jgi:cell division protein FtsB